MIIAISLFILIYLSCYQSIEFAYGFFIIAALLFIDIYRVSYLLKSNLRCSTKTVYPLTSLGRALVAYCDFFQYRYFILNNQIEEYVRLEKIQEIQLDFKACADVAGLYQYCLKFIKQYLKPENAAIFYCDLKNDSFNKNFMSLNPLGLGLKQLLFIKAKRLWREVNYDKERLADYNLVDGVFLKFDKVIIWLGFRHVITLFEKKIIETAKNKLLNFVQICLFRFENEAVISVTNKSTELMSNPLSQTLTHDIKAPLNNIKSALSLLVPNTEEDKRILAVGLKNCEIMSEIVDNISDFKKIAQGQVLARKEVIDPAVYLKEVASNFELTAKLKGIEFVFNLKYGFLIEVDLTHFKRIVINLISNAVKYTEKGLITFKLEKKDNSCLLTIVDTGVGMSKTELSRLYSPYQRFKPEMADGFGIGLYIVKSLLELNAAKLSVNSKEGRGTEFCLSFPLISEKKQILIVDNDSDTVFSFAHALERQGFNVLTALNIHEACQKLELHRPEVLLTDCKMPAGGGKQLLNFLKEKSLSIKTIVVSGAEEDEIRENFKNFKIDKFLIKPVDINSLVLAING